MTPSPQPSAAENVNLIPLCKGGKPIPGLFAKVDAADYPWLSKYRWYVLGRRQKKPYARTSFPIPGGAAVMYMHRWILGAEQPVDHINGDGLDNRRCNLRVATLRKNNWNVPKRLTRSGKPASSKFKGVYRPANSKKWWAKITHDGKRQVLGQFDTEEEAARVYNEAAARLFGEFAFMNVLSS